MELTKLFNIIITRAIDDGYGENKAIIKYKEYKEQAMNDIGLSAINAKRMALEWLENDLCEFEFDNNFDYIQFLRNKLNLR